MAQPVGLQLGRAVDSLATCMSVGSQDVLVAGLSNFIGQYWTGNLALIAAKDDGGVSLLAASEELQCGLPAVAALPDRDPYTGEKS